MKQFAVKKPLLIGLPVILLATAFLMIFFPNYSVRAEIIDDSSPELTLITMNSDAEREVDGKALYTPDSDLTQGNGAYTLTTNAYTAWEYNDDIAFAYKVYNVGEKDEDYLEATVRIPSIASGNNGELDAKASVGLMMRSGLDTNAAEMFVHLRGANILVVYRTKTGNLTQVQYTGIQITFPVELRAVKKSNVVKLSYKSSGMDWVDFRYPVVLNAPGPLYVGLAAHSYNSENYITGQFNNLKITGIGTYDGSDSSGEGTTAPSEYVEEDSPLPGGYLMRETFSDGNLTDGKAAPDNPIWDNPEDVNIINLDGNRVWHRRFSDAQDSVGSWKWTDYVAGMDFQFTSECNPNPESASNTLRLSARYKAIQFYGISDYSAVIKEGYKLFLYKRNYLADDVTKDGYLIQQINLRELYADPAFTLLGDGKWHRLELEVFDNKLKVSLDEQTMIEFTDTGVGNVGVKEQLGHQVFTEGGLCIGTVETSVYIDNVTVKKLDDPFGGDYDNTIGGNWDDPIPDYIENWSKRYP